MASSKLSAADEERDGLLSPNVQPDYVDDPPPSYSEREPATSSQAADITSLDLESSPTAIPLLPEQSLDGLRYNRFTAVRLGQNEHFQHLKDRRKSIIWLAFITVVILFLISGRVTNSPHDKSPSDSTPIPGSERNIIKHETSNSIHGTFALYDSIDLSTESGSIHATIEPRPGKKPAVIKLVSKTGSIHVRFGSSWLTRTKSNADILDRQYLTTITTDTGSIHANALVHSTTSSTTIEANTGSIHGTIYVAGSGPIDKAANVTSHFKTHTVSGGHHFKVKSMPGGDSSGPLAGMHAFHHSTGSASIHAHYPSEWQGVVHALATGSGSSHVNGRDLEYIGGQGSREITAWRGHYGNGEPTIELKSDASGSIHFNC